MTKTTLNLFTPSALTARVQPLPARVPQHTARLRGGLARSARAARGFTLVELILVIAIITVLVAVSVPRIADFMYESKAPAVANEFTRAMTRIRAVSSGATPYSTMTTAMLANNLRGTSFSVSGTGAAATVTHSLGASGATVTAAPATLVALGDSVVATWSKVNAGACATLPSLLNSQVEVIQVNGTAAKSFGGALNSVTVQNQCTVGDTNTIILTFR